MKNALQHALAAVSPRIVPPPTPLASVLIHLSVTVLWIVLFARAFFLQGAVAWSTGIAYALYDNLLLVFVTWKSFALVRPPAPQPAAAITPTLGVIVAAHDEAAVLPITLAALLAQSSPPECIVIADDGSSDGTAQLLERQFGLTPQSPGELSAASTLHPNLFWLRVAHGGKARALNAAILQMDTDVVMTVDADTLLDVDACRAMRREFGQRPAMVAAAGLLTPVCDRTLSGRFFEWFQTYEYIRNFISRYAWMRAESLLLISGAFASFRREALLTVGGFDPACLVEDYELIHRLRRYSVLHDLGWDVRLVGDARGRTDAPSTLPSFLKQRRRWFAGFLQTQYWYRDMIGNRRYGKLGTWMLPVKAFDTMQPIYGLTAFVLLIWFIVRGEVGVVFPAFGVIFAKIGIDLAFHLWSVHLYRRLSGERTNASFGMALLAAVCEPFSFQLMRHGGAALGWGHFLTRRQRWESKQRVGLNAAHGERPAHPDE